MNWLRSRVKPSDSARKKDRLYYKTAEGSLALGPVASVLLSVTLAFELLLAAWPDALAHFDNARAGSKESREDENPQKSQKERENYCEECVQPVTTHEDSRTAICMTRQFRIDATGSSFSNTLLCSGLQNFV